MAHDSRPPAQAPQDLGGTHLHPCPEPGPQSPSSSPHLALGRCSRCAAPRARRAHGGSAAGAGSARARPGQRPTRRSCGARPASGPRREAPPPAGRPAACPECRRPRPLAAAPGPAAPQSPRGGCAACSRPDQRTARSLGLHVARDGGGPALTSVFLQTPSHQYAGRAVCGEPELSP